MRKKAPDFLNTCMSDMVCTTQNNQNGLEMALEANRKDTTQTRGLVIFIPKIFSTYFCLFPEILL